MESDDRHRCDPYWLYRLVNCIDLDLRQSDKGCRPRNLDHHLLGAVPEWDERILVVENVDYRLWILLPIVGEH